MSRAQPIGEILGAVIRDLGLAKKLLEHRAVVDWGDIVGERIARRSRALRVDGGRLLVQVDSSVWAQELSLMKRRIIRELNARIGEGVVENVHFVVGGANPNDASGVGGEQAEDHGERQAQEDEARGR